MVQPRAVAKLRKWKQLKKKKSLLKKIKNVQPKENYQQHSKAK